MNSFEDYKVPQNYSQIHTSQDFSRENYENTAEHLNGNSVSPQMMEGYSGKGQCYCQYMAPPRPFKKARYAWEIKNYEFTLNRMIQSIGYNSGCVNGETNLKNICLNKCKGKALPFPYQCLNPNAFPINKGAVAENMPIVHSSDSAAHLENLSPLLATSYRAQYGAVMGTNLNAQVPFIQNEKLNNLSAQVPSDPESKLIRWQTRQLCRSIFDSTVNRMLENMGFSHLTHRTTSEALHPLLVLSLSEEERGDIEEMQQRQLETQALSMALQQKNFIPSHYHYEHTESGTNSDYDSSEDDSEIGEVTQDELCTDLQQPVAALHSQEDRINTYLAIASQNPSLPDDTAKHPFVNTQSVNYPCGEVECCCASPKSCDYQNNCDSSNRCIPTKNNSDKLPNVENQILSSDKDKDTEIISKVDSLNKCRSRECVGEFIEEMAHKKMKVDNNENCISSPESETVIEGKVEKRNLETESVKERNGENLADSTDAYFIRNSLPLSVKQQGLAYPKA